MRITSAFRLFAATSILGSVLAATGLYAQNAQPVPKQFGPRATTQAPQQKGTAQQQPPAAQVIATHGAWKVQCEAVPQAAAGDAQPTEQRTCGMVQVVQSEKNPKAGLTLVIIKTKQADKSVTMMRVMAPIGVFLPTGIALEIDGAAVGRVPFTRCMPQICMAFAEASPETLAKMKKGSEANFIIYEAPGLGLPMKMKLDGFTAAYGALDKL